MSKKMSKHCILALVAAVLFAGSAHAESEAMKFSDLETQTALAQKQLALLQAKAAIVAFNGTGGGPLPQIVSLYGGKTGMRALVDLGTAGVRDVGPGDVLTDSMSVASIDVQKGVQVAVKGSKATFHLAMKSAPVATAVGGGTSPAPGVPAPGYPMAQGMAVPPLQPMPAAAAR